MFVKLSSILAFGLGITAVVVVAQDPPPKLTARQLFFTEQPTAKTPVEPVVPEPKATPQTPPRKAVPKKPRVVVKSTPSDPKAAESASQPAVEPAKEPVKAEARTEPGRSQAVVIPYLGLRYSLLQDQAGGARQEVDPEKVFHSKERFFLSLESNDAAYLYVILKASQGTWEVLFPNPEIDHGNNRLNARTPVLVPSTSNPFIFDETPGTEQLFIVLSRQPERDLNDVIRSVQERQPDGKPAPFKTIVASNDVDRIRGQMMLASRGIAVEGVKKSSGAANGETAVYMVNTNAQDNSRVIADIVLKHE